MPYRILSMDGGGPLAVITIDLLERIERARPGFLEHVDMFAGTSAGGINALMLAAAPKPRDTLGACRDLWCRNPLNTSIPRLLRAVTGRRSVYQTDRLQRVLELHFDRARERLGKRHPLRLGDLPKHVVVPAFDLDGRRLEHRSWKPKIFHNTGARTDPDHRESVIDVALRTSAAPTFTPIHQNHVDGGLFANNPSMCALAQALPTPILCPNPRCRQPAAADSCASCGTAVPASGPAGKRAESVDDVQLLALGMAQPSVALRPRNPDWGWWQWTLDPRHPLALVEAVFDSDSMAIDFQCVRLLGPTRYYRLEPRLERTTSRNMILEGHMRYFSRVASDTSLDGALAFLDQAGWGRRPGRRGRLRAPQASR